MDIYIKGIGTYLPETVSVEQAVADGKYTADEIELHELAGVAVAGDTPAPEMALRAAQEAFRRCAHQPEDVELLLYADSWHQGPDGWQPQYYLQNRLVGGDALAVEVRQGCNGMLSGLELAAAYLRGGARHALVVSADNFGTPMMDRWTMGPGYLAGDGAAAVLLSTEPSFAKLLATKSLAVPEAEQMHRGDEPLFPPGPTSGRELDFAARNGEFRRRVLADGTGTTALVKIHQRTLMTVEQALSAAGIGLPDITRVAYMNYSREIVEQRCMAALGLGMELSTWDFGRTVGHLGASDQIVSLDHLLSQGELKPGDRMLLLGVGPGVTISCAIVEILRPAPWLG